MATAANTMPIPLPPRTPTPPPDEPPPPPPQGDPSFNDVEQHSMTLGQAFDEIYDDNRSLSPSRANFAYKPTSYIPNSRSLSPLRQSHLMASQSAFYTPSSLSPDRGRRPASLHESPDRRFTPYNDAGSGTVSPSRGSFSLANNGGFNFQPQSLAKSPVPKSVRIPTPLEYLPYCTSRMVPSPLRVTFRVERPTPSTSLPGSPSSSLNDTVTYLSSPQNIGQRRGHKYKHSSVSHQIFLEPPPRAPLALPNSLPIPTFAECRASMSTDQTLRFYWSICHMLISAYTAWNAHSSAAMEALSHLIFYDSLGALLCVAVEVLGNFEVWGRSSIRHPFGLERMEVTAGFALSVLLVFMGFDLVSHNAKHALEGLGNHTPHVQHTHGRVSAGTVDMTAIVAFASTLISAVGLKNHARIGKAMRFAAMENLPSVLSNPSHFLTLSCSATLLVLPLVSLHAYEWIDKAVSLSVAAAMLFLGAHLGRNLGQMLLMSYSGGSGSSGAGGRAVSDVIHTIETDPLVAKIEESKFWQAHYGVGMANLRLRVRDAEDEDALLRLREKLCSLVRNRLGGGYGDGRRGGQKWEVSVQFRRENERAVTARGGIGLGVGIGVGNGTGSGYGYGNGHGHSHSHQANHAHHHGHHLHHHGISH